MHSKGASYLLPAREFILGHRWYRIVCYFSTFLLFLKRALPLRLQRIQSALHAVDQLLAEMQAIIG